MNYPIWQTTWPAKYLEILIQVSFYPECFIIWWWVLHYLMITAWAELSKDYNRKHFKNSEIINCRHLTYNWNLDKTFAKWRNEVRFATGREWDYLKTLCLDVNIVVIIYLWVLLNRWFLCSWDEFLSVAFEKYCSLWVPVNGKSLDLHTFIRQNHFFLANSLRYLSLLSNSPIRMNFWIGAVRTFGVAGNALSSPRVMLKGLAALEVV